MPAPRTPRRAVAACIAVTIAFALCGPAVTHASPLAAPTLQPLSTATPTIASASASPILMVRAATAVTDPAKGRVFLRSSLRLAATNTALPQHGLVRYTRSGIRRGAASVEAVVIAGKVVSISTRTSASAPSPRVPRGGWIIAGSGMVRDWIRGNLTVGTHIRVATASSAPTTQLSGASGEGAADGTFGKWRGTPVQIGTTWNETPESQVAQWSVQPGFEWGAWNNDLDVSVGAIHHSQGETWGAAARGAYDHRWAALLTNLKRGWGTRTGTLHIRFAHEFNGVWSDWHVRRGSVPAFIAAWKRFRALQLRILPRAQLAFSPNDGSSVSLGFDWRTAFPGGPFVDEIAVSTYNQYPFVSTPEAFTAKIMGLDPFGAPLGIEQHRRFAQRVGLPLTIPEWSSNSSMGNGAPFMHLFHAWLREHAGAGAGKVKYEAVFNASASYNAVFSIFPQTAMPATAQAYRDLF